MGSRKREEPTQRPKRERIRYAKVRLNTCGLIKFIMKEKTEKITPRAREPCEMCRGKMRTSLGVVKLGILRLRLSRGLDARGCRLLWRRSVMPWWRRGSYATSLCHVSMFLEHNTCIHLLLTKHELEHLSSFNTF